MLKDKKYLLSVVFLVAMYAAGIIGMRNESTFWFFTGLTPFTLLTSAFLLYINHDTPDKKLFVFSGILIILGFLLELAGVKTGAIFGKYQYVENLGPQLFHVPVIIGLNWLILIYSVGTIAEKAGNNLFLNCAIGAFMMVVLDIFIEPTAIACRYWIWDGSQIPVQNYIAWFLTSFVFLLLFYKMNISTNNRLTYWLYALQLVFFITLSMSDGLGQCHTG